MSNPDLSYVRSEMLEQKAPPASQVGVVKWAMENLFSSVFNTVLTILGAYVIFTLVTAIVPWFFVNSIWNAGSLNECREVLRAAGLEGHANAAAAACWAVIEDRWHQLTFGFYPYDLYWRPVLAFVLLFVALAPILFAERVPGQLRYFSAAYPFLAAWLVWGGSIFTPILIALGFVAGWLGYTIASRFGGAIAGSIAAVLAAIIWWLVLTPAIGGGLDRMVAGPRMESTAAMLETRLADLPGELEAAEALRDAKQDEINAVVAEKDAVMAEVNAEQEGQDHLEPASQALQDALHGHMLTLSGLRDEHSVLVRDVLRIEQEQSESRALARAIEDLPNKIARIPELEAEIAELESTLPRELQSLRTENQLPDDTSTENEDMFKAYRQANSDLVSTANSIDSTYATVGLVGLTPVDSKEIGGFLLAVVIGLAGIGLSMPIGIVLALGRQSDLMIVNKCSVAFIEVIRGVPLIVWLFTASLLLNYFLPPGTQFDLMLRVIIMVTLFSSAYIAEVIRGGLAALPKGQYEAGDALGLDYWKSMRLIILPQALKISIPGIVSTFIGLFKDTTLVVFIGLSDPIDFSNKIRADTNWNGIYWEIFIFIGVCFFIACFSMSRYSQWLERKLNTGHR